MHILQLVPTLRIGGVERGVIDMARGLIARGHRASIISAGGPLVEELTRIGATHHTLPVDEKSLSTIISSIPKVAKFIKDKRIDIVHARSRVPAWIGLMAARLAHRPFITTAHGFYSPHFGSRVMTWGRFVIAPSESIGRYLVEQFNLPKERLRIIPRGVDLSAFNFRPSEQSHQGPWRIGIFARLSPIKGHEIAIRACERLIRSGIDIKLHIVGDTPDSPLHRRLDTLSQSLKISGKIEWLGVRQDIPECLADIDIVMVPSTYPESFGRGVIEAQAVGRPVVASRIGALAELIDDGRTGLLVHPNDPEDLADALMRFIRDDAFRKGCVTAARAHVEERWNLEKMIDNTIAVYDECLKRPRILIWKLSALGDVILATPSLRAVRAQYPKSHIALAVGRAAYEIIARCPYIDDIVIYDAKRKDRGFKGYWSFVRRLRDKTFDVSIDLQNSRKTHLMTWFAGIPVRIGYQRKFGWLLSKPVKEPRKSMQPVLHQQYLFKQAGLKTGSEKLELWPSELDEKRADRLLSFRSGKKDAAIIGLHPGGSDRWKTKRWDIDRWAKIVDMLSQMNLRVVITGGPGEQGLGAELVRRCESSPLVIIGQTSIMELACVIKRCKVFMAHDSSPLHLAAVVGTPTIAIFGPTSPKRHLPPNFKGTVHKKDVFCSPCYSPTCRTFTHSCMKQITVEEIFDSMLNLLGDSAHLSTDREKNL